MRILSVIAPAALLLSAACSGDAVPAAASVAGTWDFNYVGTTVDGHACQGTMTFTITQNDQRFTGTQSGQGTLVCTGVTTNLPNAVATDSTMFTGETIASGIASPDEVAFSLNVLRSRDEGSLSEPGKMSGTSALVIPVKPHGTITVNASWTAVKK